MSSRLKLKQAKGPFYVREETISWIPLTSWMKMKAGLCLQHCWQGLQTEIWWYFITTLSSLRDEARAFHYIEDDGLFLRVVPYYTDTHKKTSNPLKIIVFPRLYSLAIYSAKKWLRKLYLLTQGISDVISLEIDGAKQSSHAYFV